MTSVKQQGAALMIVLWVIALLMILAVSFSQTMRIETQQIKHQQGALTSKYLASEGIWRVIQALVDEQHSWLTNGTVYQLNTDKGTLFIQIQDQNGLLDVNYASAGLITTLLKTKGWSTHTAEQYADQIVDWRDSDNEQLAAGAERLHYKAAGREGLPKNAAFNSLEELRLLLSMHEQDYQKIAPLMTVYSQQSGLNLSVLPVSFYTENERKRLSDLTNEQLPRLPAGRCFVITSRAEVRKKMASLKVAVLLNPDQSKDYAILSWQEITGVAS
ncbi:MAG: hypothetical protein CMH22_03535 [Methylophaga sp.]|uniref:general secretion pathway protein GspK n=1 Tax=Methylophaga sp. UBA678 TaxID=1946901 RepID=UPI000C5383B8|nr:type II secretion system protein GspK [Methylophaga sp. UBA678]MAX51033.1 hypothetical protein [Methylophaga sp.]|tara:strand:+ start:14872 stop:15690 length:819 start_codon:yes stop_codon:yes gene_type:complete